MLKSEGDVLRNPQVIELPDDTTSQNGTGTEGEAVLKILDPDYPAAPVNDQTGDGMASTPNTSLDSASNNNGGITGTSGVTTENQDVLSYEEWSEAQSLGHGTFEDYGRYLESQGIGVAELGTVYDTANGKGFSSTVAELLPDTKNKGFDTNIIQDVIKKLEEAAGVLSTPLNNVKTIAEKYDALNEDLRNKLSGEIGSGIELQYEIERTINFMHSFTLDLRDKLQSTLTNIEDKDNEHSGEDSGTSTGVILDGGSSGGYHGSSSSGNSSTGDIGKVTGTDNTPSVFVESAVVGTLTFATIVPLFDELGKPSTIQSSLTSEYDVVGIFLYEGKYYYRLYDKNLKKFYYAEIDNNANFTTEYTDLLKMNEDAMMLSSPDIGQSVLTKMTDLNEVYFVNGTLPGEGDYANITFANIVDGMDGKTYYVPLSDSVEMVTLDVFKAGILGDTTGQDTDVSNNVG